MGAPAAMDRRLLMGTLLLAVSACAPHPPDSPPVPAVETATTTRTPAPPGDVAGQSPPQQHYSLPQERQRHLLQRSRMSGPLR